MFIICFGTYGSTGGLSCWCHALKLQSEPCQRSCTHAMAQPYPARGKDFVVYDGIGVEWWECRWTAGCKLTANYRGVSGHVTIIRSSGGVRKNGSVVKIHLCPKAACEGRWPDNKYDAYAEIPRHVRMCHAWQCLPPAEGVLDAPEIAAKIASGGVAVPKSDEAVAPGSSESKSESDQRAAPEPPAIAAPEPEPELAVKGCAAVAASGSSSSSSSSSSSDAGSDQPPESNGEADQGAAPEPPAVAAPEPKTAVAERVAVVESGPSSACSEAAAADASPAASSAGCPEDDIEVGCGAAASDASAATSSAGTTGHLESVTAAALAKSAPEGVALQMRRAALPLPLPAPTSAAVASESGEPRAPGAIPISSKMRATANVWEKLLTLSRKICQPRAYVGYSAFLCFALSRQIRPFMYEGESRIDLVDAYCPWAADSETCNQPCLVDGICCCMIPDARGAADMMPVSADHPLSLCTHYVAGAIMDIPVPGDDKTIAGFYSNRRIAVVETVTDGDCGLDTMTLMAGLERSLQTRNDIRQDARGEI